ncbi:PelA/Pel-15E family pectate lyase [Pseudoduganella flava]|uniref:PelA/Pel-15E family pectate lyase n=2 Tax=Pseudoduganella flava TaxID=871742 RepID=A0A562PKS0_9BURK|nr:PelA/Pel-15E family pectate lyase [Pseudoduganella flava]
MGDHMKSRNKRRDTMLLLTLSTLLPLAGARGAGVGPLEAGRAPALLDQAGNPVYAIVNNYTSWLSKASDPAAALAADRAKADNIISWQMPHGGFWKDPAWYAAPWDGTAKRSGWFGADGVELGTIDNQATVTEIMFLADVYRRSGKSQYRKSARKALDFLLNMQYPSGGFPQVHPARPNSYSNHVTFNDDAMVRVLMLLDRAQKRTAPLDGNVFSDEQLARLAPALARAVDFILKAQIVQGGVRTVWCAQHDPVTYEPRGARSYELPSKSGAESARVVQFLMTRPQTAQVEAAARAAIDWYRDPATQIADMIYERVNSKATNTSPFVPKVGAPPLWYRFYDLDQDTGFFSGRLPTDNPPGTGKQYDIMLVEPERRYGYQWAGEYGKQLLAYAGQVGY